MPLPVFKTILPGKVVMSLFVGIALSCGSTNQMPSQKSSPGKSYEMQLTDRDGNRYTIKPFPGNNLWMTTNLELNIPGSYCYDNAEENCERYGRLYTWEAAQKGCSQLGDGWRLPYNEEWQQLARLYGNMEGDSVGNRERAYQSLLYNGNSKFNALLGGGRSPGGEYARLDAHGFYWTATGNDSTAWFENFAKGSQSLYHQGDGEKTRAFSVRCLKVIDSLKH